MSRNAKNRRNLQLEKIHSRLRIARKDQNPASSAPLVAPDALIEKAEARVHRSLNKARKRK